MTCEATIAAEAKKCKANEHLEGTTCVANTKQVACDNTNINSANGTVSNNQVTITRSNGSWSVPEILLLIGNLVRNRTNMSGNVRKQLQ